MVNEIIIKPFIFFIYIFCVNLLPLFILTNKFAYEKQISCVSFFSAFTNKKQKNFFVNYPCNKTRIVSFLTDISPYVVLPGKTKSLQLAMEKMKGEIMEELKSEFDRCWSGISYIYI